MVQLVIITGVSGAGKSVALHAMEDMGYFCVDNLPPQLLETFVAFFTQNPNPANQRVAIGADVRGRDFMESLMPMLERLRKRDVRYEIVFLDASDNVLIKRYKESRRTHPLTKFATVSEALSHERQMLTNIREAANFYIDTSSLKPDALRKQLLTIFRKDTEHPQFPISVVSFGFKYGILPDADLVFDVRFMNNPFYVESLREHTGLEQPVLDYVMSFPQAQTFIDKTLDMLRFLIPLYIQEGKGQLIIGVGCTGGMHRSVAIARALSEGLCAAGYAARLEHRDMKQEESRYQ